MSKPIAVPVAEKGVRISAIGLTKGGRNSKIHAIADENLRPWVLILTPGNAADCVMAQECVSLIPGIKELRADKGIPMRFAPFLTDGKYASSFSANPVAKSLSSMIARPIRDAMASSAASAGLRTSGELPPAMTSSP